MKYKVKIKNTYETWTGIKAEEQQEYETNKIINKTLRLNINGHIVEIEFKKNKKQEKKNETIIDNH